MIVQSPADYPTLKLASGDSYYFAAVDDGSKPYIKALADIMQLNSSPGQGRKVLVYCSKQEDIYSRIIVPAGTSEPVLCRIEPAGTRDEFYLMVERIAQAAAAATIDLGGALVHGALCSLKGRGAIMAGRGGVGKSTASSRLPSPWISYCDDSTLIVPDSTGKIYAHPWPTWSRFYFGGTGGSWNVKVFLPLNTLFFLSQADDDRLEPLNSSQAKSMLIDTIEHVTRTNRKTEQDRRKFILRCLQNTETIAARVPAYRLRISLDGQFWTLMEKVMLQCAAADEGSKPVEETSVPARKTETHYIYRGSSMNPTLFEPELLTVEPYRGQRKPAKGDIICFHIEDRPVHIVHRIISIKNGTIKTRGDNSSVPDEYFVREDKITGRIVAARRNSNSRVVYSGAAGVFEMQFSRVLRSVNRMLIRLLLGSYRKAAHSGVFRIIKPPGMNFKVVIFECCGLKHPKLVLNGRTAGSYNFRTRQWIIRRPYRLFVDENSLPCFESPRIRISAD